jgi:hypothetical protein
MKTVVDILKARKGENVRVAGRLRCRSYASADPPLAEHG